MPGIEEQESLIKEINSFNLDISPDVFHFDFDRNQADNYLKEHPEVPFILRSSRFNNYFAMDIPYPDRDEIRHLLVSPPKSDDKKFILSTYEDSVFNEFSSLRDYVERLWNPAQKRMLSSASLAWEQFKLRQEQNQEHKSAVMSIQSLDLKKIALSAEEVQLHAKKNPGLKYAGDGHTGFAMAMALNAPFVVVRSKENREESTGKLQDHIGHDGLIVVTGHGRPGGDGIQGNYINSEDLPELDLYRKQIERGPQDIVSSAMDAGLKSGNHITILLSICYGALETSKNAKDSFAHKLAREFAAQGISSTIIASNNPVLRFGTNAIVDGIITFNNNLGMAPDGIRVFTTTFNDPDLKPILNIYNPRETIQLTKNGMEFFNPNKPLINSQQALEEQRLQKQAEEEQRLQKQLEEEQRLQKQLEEEQRLQKQLEEEQRLQKQAEEEQRLQKLLEEEQRLQKQLEEEQRLQKQLEEEQRLQKQLEEEQCLQKRIPEEQRFHLLLDNLLFKGADLKKRLDQVDMAKDLKEYHNLQKACEAVLVLEKSLRTNGNDFFANPSEKHYFSFKNQCDKDIKTARKTLDQHRGWSEFLINLAIGICTLGIGLLVKAGINMMINKPLLFVHHTDSAQKANEINNFVSEIKLKY